MNRSDWNSPPPRSRHRHWPCRLLGAALLVFGSAHAADGDPDTSFGGDGVNYVEWAGGPAEDARLGLGSDGRVYVGATINRGDGNGGRDLAITRLRSDGGLDIGFGALGYRSIEFNYVTDGNDYLRGVFPLADGKLMLLGNAQVANAIPAAAPPAMVRLTATGNVDTTFGVNGKLSIGVAQSPWPNAQLYLRGVARQRDGKFLFGGYCINCVGNYSAVVLRINVDGTIDASFGQNGWGAVPVAQPAALWSMAIDRQDRIVVAGNVVDGVHRPMVVRMTPTGSLDTAFGGGDGVATFNLADSGEVDWGATAVAVDRDDALLVSVANYLPLASARTGVIRLLANGSLHLDYGNFGLRELSRDDGSKISALALRSDSRLVAAGWIDNGGHDFYVARLQPLGAFDNDFAGNGVARYALSTNSDEAQAMLLSAGKPVIAGRAVVSGGTGIAILRLQSDLIFSDGMD